MARAYKNIFEGKEREIADDVVLEGYLPAARRFGVENPGIAWIDYCREITGKEPMPTTKFSLQDIAGIADHIVSALLRKLQAQDDEISRLRGELARIHEASEIETWKVKHSSVDLMRLLSEAK